MPSGRTTDEGERERRMTVVKVRAAGEHQEVLFAESARIYRLLRDNPAYDDALRHLGAAARSGRQVRVRFTEPNGEVIEGAKLEE